MAYANLAEVDPIYGLYTAIFPVLIYAILGPSKHVSMGTNPLTSILVGSVMGRYQNFKLVLNVHFIKLKVRFYK